MTAIFYLIYIFINIILAIYDLNCVGAPVKNPLIPNAVPVFTGKEEDLKAGILSS